MEQLKNFAGVLKDSLYWHLDKKKPFIINDEYKLELVYIDNRRYTAKIRITKISNGEVQEMHADV